MDYDVEREKRKTEEIRKAFRECFPLADENDLPFAPSHIRGFLRDRIEKEVKEGIFHFQSRVCRVLCEVSPPKTHMEDMARICVEQAKEVPILKETIKSRDAQIDAMQKRFNWLQSQLHALPEVAEKIGLDKNWIDLQLAIEKARTARDQE